MTRADNKETVRTAYDPGAGGFLIPPITWAVYFVAAYALTGVACFSSVQDIQIFGIGLVRLILAVITLLAIGIVLGTGVQAWRDWRHIRQSSTVNGEKSRRRREFLIDLSLLMSGLFLVALIWIGVPALILDACAVTLSGP